MNATDNNLPISFISPAEYLCLKNRVHAGPIKIITLVIQDLCLKKVINVNQKLIKVHRRDKRKRLRLFFTKGEIFYKYQPAGLAEKFILDLMLEVGEFRFYQLRNYFKHHFGKDEFDNFKKYYVTRDISNKGLYRFFYFRTDEALRLIVPLEERLDFIEKNINQLLNRDRVKLIFELNELGNHILNLSEETLEKIVPLNLDKFDKQMSDSILLNSSIFETEFEGRGQGFGTVIGLYGGGLGNSTDTGVFGGGSFGGGGAGGSW